MNDDGGGSGGDERHVVPIVEGHLFHPQTYAVVEENSELGIVFVVGVPVAIEGRLGSKGKKLKRKGVKGKGSWMRCGIVNHWVWKKDVVPV